MKKDLLANATVSHYRIVAKLGAGGMGEVWLAEDTRLKRKVALKLLPAELTADAERVRRFEQEAHAASALNHPNIITVYDIGDCEAGRFIVMELVAGQTLRSVIAADNSLETFLSLSQQMAKALSAAHAANITHRDIKPDNIMVRDDGYVKVLDFGLARLRSATESDSAAATLAQQTTPGTVLGTVAYMSPEQARGETVSHSSDIFALGIVLYELATGRHPFKAETLVGYLHSITQQTPAPPQQWQPKLPAALNDLLLRMLNKDASQRPTASEVGQALQAIERRAIARVLPVESETLILPATGQPATSPTQSIAVLPFANISTDEENEYFCDGLAEELLNALAKIDELKVAARTSAFSFKGKNTEAREIGKTLNVNTVLEGSVRKAGQRIRINVQLVNAADGYQLWSERYDREMKDIFDVQDEITLAVMDALKVKLLGAKKAAVLKRHTDNTEAYQLYLKGRFQFGKYTEAGWRKAIEYFEQALALEPDYAPAHAGVAEACRFLWYYGLDTRPEVIARERTAVARALEIDVELADAYRSRGALQFVVDWNFSAAGRDFEQALAFNPNDALSHTWYGCWLLVMGQVDQAVTATQRAQELDPFSLTCGIAAGWTLWYAKRYDECLGLAQALLEIDPHFSEAFRLLGLSHWGLEDYAKAEEPLRKAVIDVSRPLALVDLCIVYAYSGKQKAAQETLQQLHEIRERGYVPALYLAYAYIGLGETKEAFIWLEKALAERNGELVFLGLFPERMNPLRQDPRFADMLRRIGLPTEEQSQTDESLEANTLLLAPATSGKQAGVTGAASATQRHTVGRERERNELRAAFNATKGGRGSLVCVAGEPGIGKTTLVEDFLTELATTNQGTLARGRCSERLAGTEAYLPLLEALENLLQNDSHLASTMKQIAPTWYAQVMPLAGDSEETVRLLAEVKAASQERMKRELASFLQAVATPQPLVIFFDDLHWADVSTIDLLSFLAGKFDALRVLIVVTYRPSDMLLAKHPFLQIRPDLQARGVCRELLLEFLTEAEIAAYLTLEFPRHAFPPDFAKLIHAKTEGSPLFMADLVRYLRDRRVIAQTSGSWKLEQTLPDIERELPESVRGMIERKIAQLREEDHKLLTAASVQGYEFDSAVVAQVLKLEADEVEERLEKLERVFAFVKLVSESEFPNRTLTLKYRFVHVLYQNALYAGLRVTRKASLSAAVAQSLLNYYGAQSHNIASELANLYEVARDFVRATEQFTVAAQQAGQVFANAEAIQLARSGLNTLQALPVDEERDRQELGLQLTLGLSLAATTFWAAPEVGAVHRRALALCRQQTSDPLFFQVLTGLWSHHVIRAELREASEFSRQILQLAETAQDSFMLELAHCFSGITLHHLGALDEAERHFAASLSLYRPGQNLPYHTLMAPSVGAASEWARNLWAQGYPDQALHQVKQAYELAESQANPGTLGFALVFAAFIHQLRREVADCQNKAEAVITLSREKDIADNILWASCARGWAIARQGRSEEGLAQLRETTRNCKSVGAEIDLTHFLALLAEACMSAGQIIEASVTIDEALTMTARNRDCYYDAELYRLRGEVMLLNGAAETKAESCYQQAITIAQQQSAKSWELRAATSLARLWQRQGKIAEAWQMLAEIYGWFTEGFDTADLQEAKALLAELTAPQC